MSSTPSTSTGPDYGTEPFGSSPARTQLATSADAGRSNFRTSVIQLDRPGDASEFGEQTRREAAELIGRYPAGEERSALLPLLHLVQSEQGYVTPDGIAFCAEILDITKAQVAAVVTFYTMYKRKPTGEYLVSVCTNTLCGVLGGDEIFAALREQLGIGNNETTPDGAITLEHAECLAACDYAPVVTVNYEFFDNQTVDSARGIVDQLQSGERPAPTRGAPLCTFREIERQIAGLHDDAALALDANGSGVPTEIGVKLAVERGDTAPSYAVDTTPKPAIQQTGEPAKKATAKKAPAKKASGGARPAASRQPTSDHDAPLETAESDTANPAKPSGGEDK
ncbi:MAG: NADH-quinone oxidoreductase subunit [Pseudonocardiales bacterium]|nr:NADH-quinone oxidoreductase subunit [Pseudonocardiales bacterium]